MSSNSPRLSLARIFWTDYPAFISLLVPIVSLIVILAWIPDWRGQGSVISAEARPCYLSFAVIASAGGLLALAGRLLLFYRIFRSGALVKGKISKVEIKRDRGRVEYAYIFDHQEYLSGAAIHRNAQTKKLKSGDHVSLLVDPSNPRRAFICDLYAHP